MSMSASFPVSLQTVALLIGSNLFMTYAWYGHLKTLGSRPWLLAALCMVGAVYFIFRG